MRPIEGGSDEGEFSDPTSYAYAMGAGAVSGGLAARVPGLRFRGARPEALRGWGRVGHEGRRLSKGGRLANSGLHDVRGVSERHVCLRWLLCSACLF